MEAFTFYFQMEGILREELIAVRSFRFCYSAEIYSCKRGERYETVASGKEPPSKQQQATSKKFEL